MSVFVGSSKNLKDLKVEEYKDYFAEYRENNCEEYRGTSFMRKRPPLRTTVGP